MWPYVHSRRSIFETVTRLIGLKSFRVSFEWHHIHSLASHALQYSLVASSSFSFFLISAPQFVRVALQFVCNVTVWIYHKFTKQNELEN